MHKTVDRRQEEIWEKQLLHTNHAHYYAKYLIICWSEHGF